VGGDCPNFVGGSAWEGISAQFSHWAWIPVLIEATPRTDEVKTGNFEPRGREGREEVNGFRLGLKPEK
jgi:hypothetical protein